VATATRPRLARSTDVTTVDVHNFVRAETDRYFSRLARGGGFGRLAHRRTPPSVEAQDVVRMNRDTLYSSGVFDLDAAPVTITLPDPEERFMSLQVVSQDHYSIATVYGPSGFTFDRDIVGTRYVALLIRTFANADDPSDVAAANQLQNEICTEQERAGALVIPHWDRISLDRARMALSALGSLGPLRNAFGRKGEVDACDHLIGTAVGWGGNPRTAADYRDIRPPNDDGKTVYRLTLDDVPVDAFWSVSIYNSDGFFVRNERNAYSFNNRTARPNADGSYTIQFGGCADRTVNCLPTPPGWNCTLRLYRPRKEILDGRWQLPELEAIG
jgi:hypothetical protein